MDPATLAIVGLVGSGISAGGSVLGGFAQGANYDYQAQVAANNAKIAQQNALWTAQSGETAATNEGLKTRAAIGQEKATQGAAGIDVNTGSAADVRAGEAETGMTNAMTIRSNASRQAYGEEVQAQNDIEQSQLDKSAGSQAEIGGVLGAGGSLLSGVSTVGGNWLKWQNTGGSDLSGTDWEGLR